MDVGNSGVKWRLVEKGAVTARGKYQSGDTASLHALYAIDKAPSEIWISSVGGEEAQEDLAKILVDKWGVAPWFARTQRETSGLVNSYAEPERMGVDRWLAMLGARARISGRTCVVDAGSATTIDIIAADGLHEGGYIIPGPALMERALLLDTDRVRFSEDAAYELRPGKSTAEAVRHGVALAQAGAVAMALEQQGIENRQLIFCGGGGDALRVLLDSPGQWAPDLVLEGLALMAAVIRR